MELIKSLFFEKKDEGPIFIDKDKNAPFPEDVISHLKKKINKGSKDWEQEWKSGIELTNWAFDELDIDRPLAYNKSRWEQYVELLHYAVKQLKEARGEHGDWKTTI